MNENTKKETDTEVRDGFAGVTAPPAEELTDTVSAKSRDDEKRAAAIDAVKKYLGDTDRDTGLKFVFSYDGTEISDGKEYIKVRVSTRTEDGVNTLYGYYLADEEGNVVE